MFSFLCFFPPKNHRIFSPQKSDEKKLMNIWSFQTHWIFKENFIFFILNNFFSGLFAFLIINGMRKERVVVVCIDKFFCADDLVLFVLYRRAFFFSTLQSTTKTKTLMRFPSSYLIAIVLLLFSHLKASKAQAQPDELLKINEWK